MPRRKTRKCATKKENIDPDASLLPDEADEKTLKKESFLRDFDIQVKRRLAVMESEMKLINKEIERMFTTQKLLIKKDIRTLKVSTFLERGGDLNTFDLNEISSVMEDVSFHEVPSEDVDATFKAPVSTVKRTTRKRGAVPAPSPLTQDAPLTRSTRSTTRKPLKTPSVSAKNTRKPMQTPLITPKFDPRLPLTVAREPKKGETLMSLAGSPVLHTSKDEEDSDNVISLCLSKQQTYLGGSLFDVSMSPNTLMTSKERLQEVMSAINSRLEDLDCQNATKSN